MLLESTTSDLKTLSTKASHSEESRNAIKTSWNEMIVLKCIAGSFWYYTLDGKLGAKLGFIQVAFIYILATFLLILSLVLL